MNKTYSSFLLILMLVFGFSAQAQDHEKNVNTKEDIGSALPAFDFEMPNGERLTPEKLPPAQPVIVFYFDPFCDHCNAQAKMIQENADLMRGITMIWVSWAEDHKDNIDFFKKYFAKVPTRTFVVRDDKFAIDDYFGYSQVPSIYVYNKNWLRTATFRAESDPEILVKFANQIKAAN